MTDEQRLDWLDFNANRVRDVYRAMATEGWDVREAIDKVAEKEGTAR